MPKIIDSVEWKVQNLPSGLDFNTQNGTFSGIPADYGDYVIPVTVTTNYGTDTKDMFFFIEDAMRGWERISIYQTSDDSLITSSVSPILIADILDTGNKLLLFHNQQKGSDTVGYYCTYNPSTKSHSGSDFIRLFDDVPLSEDNSGLPAFVTCDLDNTANKWAVMLGSKYLRTPEGVKDFGFELNSNLGKFCYSPELQKFCYIGWESIYNAQCFTFDINGNFSEVHTISGFYYYPYGNGICWSPKLNKFFAASGRTDSKIISSEDGLNWAVLTLDASNSGYIYNISWLPEQEKLLAVKYNQSSKVNYIYTSEDGINWTQIKTLNAKSKPIYSGAWSPTKETFCLAGAATSFTTKDFETWSEWTYPYGHSFNPSLSILRWSPTLNAFAFAGYTQGFLVLHI